MGEVWMFSCICSLSMTPPKTPCFGGMVPIRTSEYKANVDNYNYSRRTILLIYTPTLAPFLYYFTMQKGGKVGVYIGRILQCQEQE